MSIPRVRLQDEVVVFIEDKDVDDGDKDWCLLGWRRQAQAPAGGGACASHGDVHGTGDKERTRATVTVVVVAVGRT
jgi:hypothetical protein